MQCPSCGTRNNYYHRYCYNCGYKLLAAEEPEDKYNKPTIGLDDFESTVEQKNKKTETPSNINNSFDYEEEEYLASFDEQDFNYTQQIPLRRYRKDKNPSGGTGRVAKICVSVIVMAVLIFAGYIITDQLSRSDDRTVSYSPKIMASTFVESTTVDGKPAHRIVVNTSNGEIVKALGEVYPVINGRAEIVYEDAFLYSYFSQNDQSHEIKVQLDIVIYKEGLPEAHEKIEFTLDTPLSPLTLIQPSTGEAFVEGKKYRIVLMVEPGSQVFINGNNYSDLVDKDGRLEREVHVPDTPENIYEIRVSTKNHADHIRNIILKREVMEFPLIINESVPVKAIGEWAKITGNTHPQAVLDVSLETRSQPEVDPDTGDFALYVKATALGYTPCTITAHMEGKKASTVNFVIERSATEAEYTRQAWALDYIQLKSYPELHNGRVFLVEGTVKDIISLGDKNVFTVDVSNSAQSPQLVFIEYWGSTAIRSGGKVRIFANRWGNHENMPRLLAKYIYRY